MPLPVLREYSAADFSKLYENYLSQLLRRATSKSEQKNIEVEVLSELKSKCGKSSRIVYNLSRRNKGLACNVVSEELFECICRKNELLGISIDDVLRKTAQNSAYIMFVRKNFILFGAVARTNDSYKDIVSFLNDCETPLNFAINNLSTNGKVLYDDKAHYILRPFLGRINRTQLSEKLGEIGFDLNRETIQLYQKNKCADVFKICIDWMKNLK